MRRILLTILTFAALPVWLVAAEGEKPRSIEYPVYPPAPVRQDQAVADQKSAGCVSCHTSSDAATMHVSNAVVLGCTELPLILNEGNSSLPTLDSTRLLARAALCRAIEGATARA